MLPVVDVMVNATRRAIGLGPVSDVVGMIA
jgi:hypothetical protein